MKVRWSPETEDGKKFTEMWVAGMPIREIAKEFDLKLVCSITYVKKRLGLKNRRFPSVAQDMYFKRIAKEADERVLNYLKTKGRGYATVHAVNTATSTSRGIRRLMFARKIIRVEINLSRQPGSYVFKNTERLFKKAYINQKYYCLGRSGVVCLLMDACKKPQTRQDRHVLTHFLRSILSEAEMCAVLWKIGIRHWKRNTIKKQSIQVDGVLFPHKRFVEP